VCSGSGEISAKVVWRKAQTVDADVYLVSDASCSLLLLRLEVPRNGKWLLVPGARISICIYIYVYTHTHTHTHTHILMSVPLRYYFTDAPSFTCLLIYYFCASPSPLLTAPLCYIYIYTYIHTYIYIYIYIHTYIHIYIHILYMYNTYVYM